MQNKKDVVINGSPEPHKRKKLSLILLAAVIVLVVGGVLLFLENHNKQPATYKTIEDARSGYAKQVLKDKDYNAYQLRLATDADDYISKKDYANAENTLTEIIQNVPQDKITSQTYRAYWYLYQQKGDALNRKKYALLTAEKLKAEGQTADASTFEEDAKEN